MQVRNSSGARGYAPSTYLREAGATNTKFRVTADYFGSGTQLSIFTGEVLTLVRRVPASDWIEVTNARGETGYAPITYVEEYDENIGPRTMYRAKASLAPAQVCIYSGEW
jgi:hypothetical protein